MKRLYVELVSEDASIPVYDEEIEIGILDCEVESILIDTSSRYDVLYESMMTSMEYETIYLYGVEMNLAVIVDALMKTDTPEGEQLCEDYLGLAVDVIVRDLRSDGISELIGGDKLVFRLTEMV